MGGLKDGGMQLLSGGGEAKLEMWHDPSLLGLSQLACLEELPRDWGWGMVPTRRVVVGAEWCCGEEMRQDEAKGLNGKVFIGWCEESNYIKCVVLLGVQVAHSSYQWPLHSGCVSVPIKYKDADSQMNVDGHINMYIGHYSLSLIRMCLENLI